VRPHFNLGDVFKRHNGEERPLSKQDQHAHPTPSMAEPITAESPSTSARDGERSTRPDGDIINPRKRKLEQASSPNSLLDLELEDIFDYLPSQPLLLKLVDHFCVTFHHWIPYLHKQRLRNKVCNLTRDPQLSLVLHALVAATLRHLKQDVTFMDKDQILHQTRVSRFIVETFALKDVSLESLRALIIIVFDYVSMPFHS
jgi:hypothetical protein